MRKTLLLAAIPLGLQSCTFHASEKYACRDFAGWSELPAPPENAEQLYAIPDSGGPPNDRRYHEHWYRDPHNDNVLGSCRHLKNDAGGCGTQCL
jgi:hypothetical protein